MPQTLLVLKNNDKMLALLQDFFFFLKIPAIKKNAEIIIKSAMQNNIAKSVNRLISSYPLPKSCISEVNMNY